MLLYSLDFEDGNTSGWLESTTGGSGSTGVELHNGSNMAFVQHSYSGLQSLSIDFSYLAGETLSFDMHVIPNKGTQVNASGGVKLSFLNSFNNALGSASLVNTTNPAALGPHDILIDGVQHHYSNLLSDYVTLAGLDATAPIAKFSLTYFAYSEHIQYYDASSSKVWFDNVNVSAVPVPAAVWLFGSALLGLTGLARRKKI